jgi:hypothetical protein
MDSGELFAHRGDGGGGLAELGPALRKLGLERLRPPSPFAAMIVATHP